MWTARNCFKLFQYDRRYCEFNQTNTSEFYDLSWMPVRSDNRTNMLVCIQDNTHQEDNLLFLPIFSARTSAIACSISVCASSSLTAGTFSHILSNTEKACSRC